MRDEGLLRETLSRLEGRGYKAYRDLEGVWAFDRYALSIDHVQGDPFASPSRFSLSLTPALSGLSESSWRSPARALGTAAHLARRFANEARDMSVSGRARTGRSGELRMAHPGQVVLPQTAVQLHANGLLEARFTVGLPGRGRRIDGEAARELLLERLPDLIRATLLDGAHDPDEIEEHAALNEDAEALRCALSQHGLVGFVADGAVLPRSSGVDDRPLSENSVVRFESPLSMRVSLELPNRGIVTGLGVPEGITLIVGGGFHGKSTVLRALQAGVWNHCAGDGRELVVTRSSAVKIRAEDGRSIASVDISSFIDDLPGATPTETFTTSNASGSTSQAASIIEALEAGTDTLLIDEDTSATNFMIRDRRMQELVPSDGEPITPFIDRVQELHGLHGISTVLVLGGSGDYLDVADHVIRMDGYRAHDVTREASEVSTRHPTRRRREAHDTMTAIRPRSILWSTVDPSRGRRDVHIRVPDRRTLLFGNDTVDLVALEQLTGNEQVRAIGLAIAWAVRTQAPNDLPGALDRILAALDDGLDTFDAYRTGDLASFRRVDVAAVLNRLRSLCVD